MLRDFTSENFDVIILAGQSNSEGNGCGYTANPYLPGEKVWYMNGDFSISMATEWVKGNQIQTNYALSFANQYILSGLLEEGRKILILRAAIGGTGFSNHKWGLTEDLFIHMIEMAKTALELNSKNRLVALLWHQGEQEAVTKASYELHYNNLITLVNTTKEIFNYPDLPFIAGDFVPQWKNENIELCKPVVKAMRDVCKAVNGRFVDTDGLLSNAQTYDCDDKIHFSRDSLYRLGEKYFDAFKEVIK